MRKSVQLLALALTSSSLWACGSEATPPAEAPVAEPAPAANAEAPADSEKPGDNPAQSDINISDEIRKACGLTDTEAHFAYNSAKVKDADRTVMKKLADCFLTGGLKGRTMALVGHADPRGEAEYNMVLGGRRADNVAQAVTREGLPAKQITTTSRGAMDAKGSDEASWALDRRVDVHLAAAE